uniref:Uncharacterized protein n=1 Tax=Aegilops tauschii subsp. strangulata TaxID=200361 RepID=A0A453LUJ4_AEGTS
MPILVHISSQCWSIHRQAKSSIKFLPSQVIWQGKAKACLPKEEELQNRRLHRLHSSNYLPGSLQFGSLRCENTEHICSEAAELESTSTPISVVPLPFHPTGGRRGGRSGPRWTRRCRRRSCCGR